MAPTTRSKSAAPVRIAPGNRIALVAPAGPLLEHDDLIRAEELCRALGLEPVLGRNASAHHGYFAGTDAERLSDLNAALTDPAIDAVWCIRGGFGVSRILADVDFDGFAARPKPVVGFSDITALLLALHHRTGTVTFHGPVARKAMTPFTRAHFERILTHAAPAGVLDRVPALPGVLVPADHRISTLVPGTAEGRLLGGNLSLLQCLVGTPFMPDLRGAILFLEDVGEEIYRVDRMLSHFRLAGLLDDLGGIVIGRFTEMGRRGADGAMGFDQVLHDYFDTIGVPAAYGFPIGHVDDQWTIPVGVSARLDADRGTLEILEAAVC